MQLSEGYNEKDVHNLFDDMTQPMCLLNGDLQNSLLL